MFEFSDTLAIRADQVRVQVLQARRIAKAATASKLDDSHFGRWSTADAFKQRLTVTISLREAVALVRVIGPLDDRRDASQIKQGGPAARFLAAIHVVRQAVLKQPEGGMASKAALSVLRLALDDLDCSFGSAPQKKSVRHR